MAYEFINVLSDLCSNASIAMTVLAICAGVGVIGSMMDIIDSYLREKEQP